MSHSDFQLKGDHAYLDQLEKKDRDTLHILVEEVGNLMPSRILCKEEALQRDAIEMILQA